MGLPILEVGIPETRELSQVVGDVMGLTRLRRAAYEIRELAELANELDLLREGESRGVEVIGPGHSNALLAGLAFDPVCSRMSILNVVGGILSPVAIPSEVEIEVEMAFRLSLDQERRTKGVTHSWPANWTELNLTSIESLAESID